MIASLPMYDWPELRVAHDAFWKILAEEFSEAGFDAPNQLERAPLDSAHWLHPDLLLSQTCGFPFATRLLGKVSLLTTPCYDVVGCEGPSYSSAILVARDLDVETLDDALSGTFAYNSMDSLSGYRCLWPLIGDPSTVFSKLRKSGSHRQSALMIANGDATCAAVDAVCWSMFQRFEPKAASCLRVLHWGPSFPALPYITHHDWNQVSLENLRHALCRGIQKAALTPDCSDLKIADCRYLDQRQYEGLKDLVH